MISCYMISHWHDFSTSWGQGHIVANDRCLSTFCPGWWECWSVVLSVFDEAGAITSLLGTLKTTDEPTFNVIF